MLLRTGSLTALALVVVLARLSWGQQLYLYTPKEVTAEERSQAKDGVLVEDVPVKKGDTLYGLSRRFSGRGMYYPQILLFNKIKNPNLIYPGDVIKVPVSHQAAPPARVSGSVDQAPPPAEAPRETAVEAKKPETAPAVRKGRGGRKAAVKRPQPEAARTERPAAMTDGVGAIQDAAAGQQLFERAVKAYRQDDFRKALELFDRFLADNPNSPLAADASLYKAECYLKMSAQ